MRKQQVKKQLAVSLTKNISTQRGVDQVSQFSAVLGKIRQISVMGENPAAVLERVRVQRTECTLRCLANMCDDGLGSDNARHVLKQAIVHRRSSALDQVRCAAEVVGYAPAIRVVRALDTQRIFSPHQTAVDLTTNHRTKAKQSAHADTIGVRWK